LALNHIRKRNIRVLLLITMFLVFGLVLAVFIGYRTISIPQEVLLSSVIQDDATISIGKVHQTSTRDGIKEWRLDATSAHFIDEEKLAVFDDLSVTFFLKNGDTVAMSAQEGYLKTDTQDIRIQGNVVVDDGAIKILTDTLNYDHHQRVLVAKKPVEILGSTFHLMADSASYDLASQQTIFDGHVEGTIFDYLRF